MKCLQFGGYGLVSRQYYPPISPGIEIFLCSISMSIQQNDLPTDRYVILHYDVSHININCTTYIADEPVGEFGNPTPSKAPIQNVKR